MSMKDPTPRRRSAGGKSGNGNGNGHGHKKSGTPGATSERDESVMAHQPRIALLKAPTPPRNRDQAPTSTT